MRLRSIPLKKLLSGEDLIEFRPNAPFNSTQFLIDARGGLGLEDDADGGEIDEHGTMLGHSHELVALGRLSASPAPPERSSRSAAVVSMSSPRPSRSQSPAAKKSANA